MELEDMKAAWQALNQQLARQQALNTQLFVESRLDKVRHGLRPLIVGQWIQFAFGVVFMIWGIAFWVVRTDVLHWLVIGVLVQLFGMSMLLAAARNLHLIQQVDYAAPIVEIQQRLAALRAWRVKFEAPIFAAIGSFAWIPLLLMDIQQDAEPVSSKFDLLKEMPSLLPNLVLCGCASLVLVFIVYWLVRRVGYRRWLENNFAGKSVQRAEAMLEQIAQFKQE
ncbi:hypothetical protein GCM10010981_26070 [Dyella nitratireducens]|uniref:Serine/threonine protein kinase n=2 Tax=Dyella nitratireducens TaxID=1849580 RepID=A0ABQ1G3R3_9GAMM|nr:hypothetical protein GCM10010981_26070 [Dyella nitratireducens]GLQ41042.1 hypothetical protein GCM10007902_08920 [Dyella nitratireducens]